jgi:hypothetical protein
LIFAIVNYCQSLTRYVSYRAVQIRAAYDAQHQLDPTT